MLKDEVGDTARSYLIRGIPTTLVIGKDGVVMHRVEGLINLDDLNRIVNNEPPNKVPFSL